MARFVDEVLVGFSHERLRLLHERGQCGAFCAFCVTEAEQELANKGDDNG